MIWDFLQDASLDELHTRDASIEARLTRLERDNYELRLRIAVLMRLLTDRGNFTPAEVAEDLSAIRPQLAAPRTPKRRSAPATKPVVQ